MRSLLLITLAIMPIVSSGFDHEHKTWNRLLQTYVKRGRVDYRKLIARDRKALNEYLKELASVSETQFKRWSREQKLAYWINAYNAYTFKAIVDNYPLKAKGINRFRFPANSIRQIPGVWDKIKFRAGGENLTLNQMEHEKLRAQLKEPRVHFAVVCASIGCPDLRNEAYTAAKIENQLEDSAQRFVNNPAKVRVDARSGTLYLSKIFNWFGEDFSKYKTVNGYGKQRGIVSFVTKYSRERNKKPITQRELKIKWLDYDWSLNEQ